MFYSGADDGGAEGSQHRSKLNNNQARRIWCWVKTSVAEALNILIILETGVNWVEFVAWRIILT